MLLPSLAKLSLNAAPVATLHEEMSDEDQGEMSDPYGALREAPTVPQTWMDDPAIEEMNEDERAEYEAQVVYYDDVDTFGSRGIPRDDARRRRRVDEQRDMKPSPLSQLPDDIRRRVAMAVINGISNPKEMCRQLLLICMQLGPKNDVSAGPRAGRKPLVVLCDEVALWQEAFAMLTGFEAARNTLEPRRVLSLPSGRGPDQVMDGLTEWRGAFEKLCGELQALLPVVDNNPEWGEESREDRLMRLPSLAKNDQELDETFFAIRRAGQEPYAPLLMRVWALMGANPDRLRLSRTMFDQIRPSMIYDAAAVLQYLQTQQNNKFLPMFIERNNENQTLLMAAVRHRYQTSLDIVRWLLDRSVRVNQADARGRTALVHLINAKPTNVVDVATELLDRGASPDGGLTRERVQSFSPTSPNDAHIASPLWRVLTTDGPWPDNLRERLLELLLSRGATVDLVSRATYLGAMATPLMYAVKHLPYLTVQLLILGVSVMKTNPRRRSRSDRADLMATDQYGQNALHYLARQEPILGLAAPSRRKEAIQRLHGILNLFEEVAARPPRRPRENERFWNQRDRYGQTALHVAVMNGPEWATKVLADHGNRAVVDVGIPDDRGDTALHLACAFVMPAHIQWLLPATPRELIDARNAQDETPLLSLYGNFYRSNPAHRDAERDVLKMVREMLARGADPRAENNEGMNALHRAVIKGWREGVKVLVREGGVQRSEVEEYSHRAPSTTWVAGLFGNVVVSETEDDDEGEEMDEDEWDGSGEPDAEEED